MDADVWGWGVGTVSKCTLRGNSARPPSLKFLLKKYIQTDTLRERDAQALPILSELKTYNTLLFTRVAFIM